jgi:uncharacterized protein YoxC
MIDAIAWAGSWLLQRSAALPDTIVTKQVLTAPTVFERVTSIASGLLTIAILIFVVAAVPAAWNFRRSYKKVDKLLERIYGDINPIMRHASAVADNIDYITTSIRTDIQQINATIASANHRLQQAMSLTERRMNDFNALLQVVQEEAEQVFVSTASTVRGVRTSASALSGDANGTKFAKQAQDGLADFAVGDRMETEEETSDVDDSYASTTPDEAPRPRVRRRSHGRAGKRGDGL